jgi:hypothetical protein
MVPVERFSCRIEQLIFTSKFKVKSMAVANCRISFKREMQGEKFSREREWAFRHQFFATGAPWKCINYIFLALATESGFLQFNKEVPFEFKNKTSAVQWESKPFRPTVYHFHSLLILA